MKHLSDFTDKKYIIKLKAKDKIQAIKELAMIFKDTNVCCNIDSLIVLCRKEKA